MMKTFNQQAPNFQQSFNSKQEFIQDFKMKQPEAQGAAGGQVPNVGNQQKENFQGQPQSQPQFKQNGFEQKPMMQQQPSGFQNPEFKPQPSGEFKPEFQANQVKEPTMAQPVNNNLNGGFEQKETFAPQPIQPMQKIEQSVFSPKPEPAQAPSPMESGGL